MDDPAARGGGVSRPGPTVLVVGATGRLAGLVVPALARRGVRVRGLVRDERRAESVRARGAAEIAVGDLGDPGSLEAAARGADGVFHIGPAFHPDETRYGLTMVAAAAVAGVRTFVFSGVIHPGNGLWNHASKLPVERALFASGMRFTILQPARFHQNLGRLWRTILSSGTFGEPFARRVQIGWVDYRDVAEVAAIALTEDRLGYGAFELCAGMADRDDIVALMSEALDREIEATEPGFEAWAEASRLPFDAWQLERMAEMFAYYDEHDLPGNSLVLRTILGREPVSLRRYLRDLATGVPTEVS
ncbi:MAG TPA: NmrA family NAD(P)-binding protein [Streptosporangiaceae bacterium]|nr:NmrA family NAD(P)-binding protein [Streptosporangiaceae bacterium]